MINLYKSYVAELGFVLATSVGNLPEFKAILSFFFFTFIGRNKMTQIESFEFHFFITCL